MQIIPPYRASHTYTQHLIGRPDQVFPLLCPVRECEWVNGWHPRLVISSSGVAEQDCVFATGPQTSESIWVVTAYEPPAHIAFLKFTPAESVARITIRLRAEGAAMSLAEITYAYTAVSERGRRVVDAFTAEHYESFMREWEAELNHFLRTGTKREAGAVTIRAGRG